ncbi:hypothetical protein [Bradyrhizobium sp. B120]|uniref:hypothetical protein n=1 Tax=Bradyrhizobium sp. B120 TaxID=3410088 RepID=UPI003B98678A
MKKLLKSAVDECSTGPRAVKTSGYRATFDQRWHIEQICGVNRERPPSPEDGPTDLEGARGRIPTASDTHGAPLLSKNRWRGERDRTAHHGNLDVAMCWRQPPATIRNSIQSRPVGALVFDPLRHIWGLIERKPPPRLRRKSR